MDTITQYNAYVEASRTLDGLGNSEFKALGGFVAPHIRILWNAARFCRKQAEDMLRGK